MTMPAIRASQVLRLARLSCVLALLAVAALALAAAGLRAADDLDPPDLQRLAETGAVVTAADGRVLRIFPSGDGILRLPLDGASLQRLDPGYLALLLAVEDKRFRDHDGVDPRAVLRASLQALQSGAVQSGASTITMQLARLLDPKPRTLAAKLEEMFRAWQLERRFGKDEILAMYLSLAPYGGRVEGVRTAALTWLGKEPFALTPGEAALLVALPQSPARLRPDRDPAAAAAARRRILERGAAAGVLTPGVAARAALEPLPAGQRPVPFHAPHLARDLVAGGQRGWPSAPVATTLDADLQAQVETILAGRAPQFGPAAGIAALVIDNRSRRVLAYAGNADFLDEARAGQVDMVTAARSPGSTLKPVIYAMAFDQGLAHPETYVRDAPASFGGYRPRNFAGAYHGDVTLREALQLSLNVPAVRLLERLGPAAFVSRLRRAGTPLALPDDTAPGLAVALGGIGITLRDLVGLYAALADDGQVRALQAVPGALLLPDAFAEPASEPLFDGPARWHVARILAAAHRPTDRIEAGYARRGLAFKTGTSYGFRDAWAVGYDRDHTVGIWLGRADGTPLPGITGLGAAAPLLFRIFDLLPAGGPPAGAPPPGTLLAGNDALPPSLRRLDGSGTTQRALRFDDGAPRITFPPDSAELDLRDLAGGLPLQAQGGARPLHWLVDGAPLPSAPQSRQAMLTPAGPGFVEVAVVDAKGRRDGISLRLNRGAMPAGAARPGTPVLQPAPPHQARP